jgi:glucosamine-6-phosphate deaminase
MTATNGSLTVGHLNVEIHPSASVAGDAAARAAARILQDLSRERETIGVVFATGASQLAILDALIALEDVPWEKIIGLHLDEYVGLRPDHPGSFRHYLTQHLTSRVGMKVFYGIDGSAEDPERVCSAYARLVRETEPQLCLMGIGENGHLAFNDPGVADFQDPTDVKVVELDDTCREQQRAEGWFSELSLVPKQAITLTLPAILRIPHLLVSVPGTRKAAIVRRALDEPISTACPATALREHPSATLYLDADSALVWEQSNASTRSAASIGTQGR